MLPLPEWTASVSLMAMAMAVDFRTYVDHTYRATKKFVNIYYETMGKRKQALTRLHLDNTTLI